MGPNSTLSGREPLSYYIREWGAWAVAVGSLILGVHSCQKSSRAAASADRMTQARALDGAWDLLGTGKEDVGIRGIHQFAVNSHVLEKVGRILRDARELGPESSRLLRIEAAYLAAKGSARLDESIELLERAIKIEPRNPANYNNLALIYERGNRHAKAEKLYRHAIGLEPRVAETHYNLGFVLEKQQRLVEAKEEYREAIRLDQSFAPPVYNLGVLLEREGLLDEAEAAYKRAIRLDPKDPQARYNLGNVLENLGRYDEAERIFRAAALAIPNWAGAHNRHGVVLVHLERESEAIEALALQA